KNGAVMANRCLAYARAMFNWALYKFENESDGSAIVTQNPFEGIEANKEKSRNRVLSDVEIWHLWRALNAEIEESGTRPGTQKSYVADSYKMRLLTAQRSNEVLNARYTDINSRAWTIEDTKNDTPHRVYLSDTAHEIVETARVRNDNRSARS